MGAIAITGATGFLGGALSRHLLGLGQSVVALGRDRAKLKDLEALGARCAACDLSVGAPPLSGITFSAIVHCAARSSAWGRTDAFRLANVRGTEAALDLARQTGAKRFVHISTPSLYFRFRDQRQVREDADLPPPVNAYAATKREAEALVQSAADLDPVILRPRGLYGAGDTALLPRLLRAAAHGPLPLVRDGAAETDLTHVDDAVSAVMAALGASANLPRRVFNISGGEPMAIRRIADAAGERTSLPIRWRTIPAPLLLTAARAMELAAHLDPKFREPRLTAYSAGLFAFTQTLDITAARTHLDWTPHVSFDEGLSRTFGRAP